MSAAEDRDGRGAGAAHYFDAPDGTRLHYRAWPVDEPRAALLVLHGLFEHSRRYIELAGFMGDAGIGTFVLDHRGHGASRGRRGHVHRFHRFLDDAEAFRREVEGRVGDLPVFLLAHSMGGLIGLRYLEDRAPALAGAIISAPWLALADPPSAGLRALASVLSRLIPILPFPAGLSPDDLSHDPERVADYRQDPLIYSTLTPRLHREVEKATRTAFERRHRLDLPLLFLLPGDDRIVSTPRSLELARSLEAPDVTIRVLDGYYHEVLQEVERAAVMAEIRGWIEAHLP